MSLDVKENIEIDLDSSKKESDTLENVTFSHQELVKLTKDAISKIIESDPLFSELPQDATLEEIKAQTAVAQGQAITLYLNRGDLPTLGVVVSFTIFFQIIENK